MVLIDLARDDSSGNGISKRSVYLERITSRLSDLLVWFLWILTLFRYRDLREVSD